MGFTNYNIFELNEQKINTKILLIEISDRSVDYEAVKDIYKKSFQMFKTHVSGTSEERPCKYVDVQ